MKRYDVVTAEGPFVGIPLAAVLTGLDPRAIHCLVGLGPTSTEPQAARRRWIGGPEVHLPDLIEIASTCRPIPPLPQAEGVDDLFPGGGTDG